MPAAPEDEVVGGSGHPLFLEVEGEDEDVAVGVRDPAPARAPGVVGEPTHRLSELSPHQHQGVAQPVALLVEGRGPEVVFGGPVEEVYFDGVAKNGPQVV